MVPLLSWRGECWPRLCPEGSGPGLSPLVVPQSPVLAHPPTQLSVQMCPQLPDRLTPPSHPPGRTSFAHSSSLLSFRAPSTTCPSLWGHSWGTQTWTDFPQIDHPDSRPRTGEAVSGWPVCSCLSAKSTPCSRWAGTRGKKGSPPRTGKAGGWVWVGS